MENEVKRVYNGTKRKSWSNAEDEKLLEAWYARDPEQSPTEFDIEFGEANDRPKQSVTSRRSFLGLVTVKKPFVKRSKGSSRVDKDQYEKELVDPQQRIVGVVQNISEEKAPMKTWYIELIDGRSLYVEAASAKDALAVVNDAWSMDIVQVCWVEEE